MSTQQLELPPPVPAAIRRQQNNHKARDAKVQARLRREEEIAEAKALGVAMVVKLTVDRSWTESEENVLHQLYPLYDKMMEKLPHRSRRALKHRCSELGLVPLRKQWTVKEVDLLRRVWSKSSPDELVNAFPRWNLKSIHSKASNIGLKPRGKPPMALTGDFLCDAIRDRCRELGYSMPELDRLAHTGTYFQNKHWTRRSGHIWISNVKAARALGGELRVEWPD